MKKERGIFIQFSSLEKLINPNQVKIIKILKENKKLNYSQIQRLLGISLRETRRYVNKLVESGLIKREFRPTEKGHPVLLSFKKS